MQYQQRLRNIQKSEEIGNDCLPSFDTDSDLFSTDFTCNSLSAAGSKSICYHIQDHPYISDGAFGEINENFFAGKLRSLDSTRFKLDLETFFFQTWNALSVTILSSLKNLLEFYQPVYVDI